MFTVWPRGHRRSPWRLAASRSAFQRLASGQEVGKLPTSSQQERAAAGHALWTIPLLANAVVERETVDAAHFNTVGRAQKSALRLHLKECWVIPPKANAAFLGAMEDTSRSLRVALHAKHGSWLDMVESELAILSWQCLSRRIPDQRGGIGIRPLR